MSVGVAAAVAALAAGVASLLTTMLSLRRRNDHHHIEVDGRSTNIDELGVSPDELNSAVKEAVDNLRKARRQVPAGSSERG
jgi:hypothetical protein